jgi:hypothetical protein
MCERQEKSVGRMDESRYNVQPSVNIPRLTKNIRAVCLLWDAFAQSFLTNTNSKN